MFCLALPVMLSAADDRRTTAKPAAAQQAKGLTLPEGAKEVEPNTYRYADPQGKTWIYRRTPFGLVRYEDRPAAEVPVKVPETMTAIDEGDSIRFETSTPFGKRSWTEKKSELSDAEQAAWDQAHKKKPAGKKTGTE